MFHGTTRTSDLASVYMNGSSIVGKELHVDTRRLALYDRGRVETLILRDHAVSARSEHLGERLRRCARWQDMTELIRIVSKVDLQMRLAGRPTGFIAQGRRVLCPHRLHQ